MQYRVKVYRWTEESARKAARENVPLPLHAESTIEAPSNIDAAKKEAERFALAQGGKRVRGCSVLAGTAAGSAAGFSVTIEA